MQNASHMMFWIVNGYGKMRVFLSISSSAPTLSSPAGNM